MILFVLALTDEQRLLSMRARASQFKKCMANEVKPKGIGGRCYTCANLSYIHVWKAAGSTTIHELRADMCPHLKTDDHSVISDSSLEFFSFVREPVGRFQSGLGEMAKRRHSWLKPLVDEAWELNATVASVAIRHMPAMNYVNPHVGRQSYFFLTDVGQVTNVSYIGLVRDLGHDLGALKRGLFNLPNATDDLPTIRPAEDLAYDGGQAFTGPFGPLRHEPLDNVTLQRVIDYYAIDFDCLYIDKPPL